MTVMSFLRLNGQSSYSKLCRIVERIQSQSVRGGHNRTLEIHPSTYTWYKFKDSLHFYFLCGFIPAAAFATYQNLHYGRSVLTETPENYEPQFYEFERHPVTRFICWMTDKHPRYNHERLLYAMNHETEKIMLRKIERQVRAVMKVRADHKSFYYIPGWQAKTDRLRRQVTDRHAERSGISDHHHTLKGELKDVQMPNMPSSRSQSKRGGGPGFADDLD